MKHEFTLTIDDDNSPDEVLEQVKSVLVKVYEEKEFNLELVEMEDASDDEEIDEEESDDDEEVTVSITGLDADDDEEVTN